ncbi:H/ACA ribonucleoprotein complex non-core subunit NAF1 isoform X2 [Selaginella moellendorffii]|uniref:H/ACA ribonucleoprotein complex non-core subunit NAF1 isoform X2 n=1 Tax=Selaginella moellendorffii TaxID=88036 RepID=UPI000D1CE4F5|nr:H/ACA ribonucleoprotein complex non-core subunit NAF1 isoform X2 [Selaginella moellendorffii]|eukprot:XP_024532745.1 H/ACA ribonucleoprotein complex non-core subunit NAF1 isoform X2 [Selaginella moellendorffii]
MAMEPAADELEQRSIEGKDPEKGAPVEDDQKHLLEIENVKPVVIDENSNPMVVDGNPKPVVIEQDQPPQDGSAEDVESSRLTSVDDDREEGEVEEDLAEKIRVSAPCVQKEENEKEEDEEEDEEDDLGETMEDSEPLYSDHGKEESSSSDDDNEDWTASFEQNFGSESKKTHKDSSDDEDDKPPRTKNEISSLPPVPKVDVQLQPCHTLVPIGTVSSIVEAMIIVEGDENHQALDEGSILWLTDSRAPLGFIDEVFGPVKKPFYVVRFNDVTEVPKEARESARVAFVPDFARTVLKNENLFKKGYDASGVDDEELSDDEVEFSDDEKEAEFKRERAKAKRKTREDSSCQAFKEKKPPRARNSSKFGNGGPHKGFESPRDRKMRSPGDAQRLIHEAQMKRFNDKRDENISFQQLALNQNRSHQHEAGQIPGARMNNPVLLADNRNQSYQSERQQQIQNYEHQSGLPPPQVMVGYHPSVAPPSYWPGQPYQVLPTPYQHPSVSLQQYEAALPPPPLPQQQQQAPGFYPTGGQCFGGYPSQHVSYMPGPVCFPGFGWMPNASQVIPPVPAAQFPPLQGTEFLEDFIQDEHSS